MKKILTVLLLLCLLLCACGQENAPSVETAAPTASPTPEPTPEPALPLTISEVMTSNKATLADEDGAFPDWVELQNTGEEPVSLAGCSLRWGEDRLTLDEEELAPGAYALILCSGERNGFALPNEEGTLRLMSPGGRELDAMSLPKLEADCSYTREGTSLWPTPGFENSLKGYAAFQQTRAPLGELAIAEAVVRDVDGDWVELWNTGDEVLSLDGYYLSDKEKDRLRYRLPDLELEPGERWTASLEDADFSLNAARDQLYLSRDDGTLMDYVNLHDIPLDGSVGRLEGRKKGGFWYFAASTRGEENGKGFRSVSPRPECPERDGVFEDVEQVTVTLTGPGTIYYTTDGSMPTAESERYTKPLVLTATGVVRAICVQKDALPGKALSLSYIINEHHTLPVTSLVTDPENLFGKNGLYDNVEIQGEEPGALMFYDGEDCFRLDCGIKPHGATSRLTQPKKTLKTVFRDCYDGDLHFDLFANGVTDFSSILLRAPREEQYSSLQRDCLLHSLAAEAFPALPSQAYRYSILYINGQYWGVYSLREAHSDAHYANHFGLDKDRVKQFRGDWDQSTGFDEIVAYAAFNDMRDEENYRHVTERLDIDSVIGWAIMEGFCGNFDLHSDNMRFYYTLDDGVMHYALVDLDAGMEDWRGFDPPYTLGYNYNQLLSRLTTNPEFRREFLRQFGEALDGPLDTEKVLRQIDEMADELRPEITRDRERWGSNLATWESLVQRNRDYFTVNGDYKLYMINALRKYMGNTPEWYEWMASREKG